MIGSLALTFAEQPPLATGTMNIDDVE